MTSLTKNDHINEFNGTTIHKQLLDIDELSKEMVKLVPACNATIEASGETIVLSQKRNAWDLTLGRSSTFILRIIVQVLFQNEQVSGYHLQILEEKNGSDYPILFDKTLDSAAKVMYFTKFFLTNSS